MNDHLCVYNRMFDPVYHAEKLYISQNPTHDLYQLQNEIIDKLI